MKKKKEEKKEIRSSKLSKLLDDKIYWYVQYGISIMMSICIAIIIVCIYLLYYQ